MKALKGLLGFFFIFGLLFGGCYRDETAQKTKQFGKVQQAIVGGHKDLRYPSVVAIVIQRRDSFCTGTLITPRLVITAAHCIDAAKNYKSQGASIDIRIDLPSGSGFRSEYHSAKLLFTHPQWVSNQRRPNNDLGLIVLWSNVTSTPPMPVSSAKMDSSWVGRKLLFLGYGLIQTRPSIRRAPQKYGAEIPISKVYADRFDNYKRGTSVCSGDSGGPALYKFPSGYRIIGVNSYVSGTVIGGRQPACDGSSTCFRIDAYLNWLQPLINKYGGQCKQDSDCGACYVCSNGKCVSKRVAPARNLCRPCSNPSQCGGLQDICVATSAGNRCGMACDSDGCCPEGYTCQDIGSGQKQCLPAGGVCPKITCQNDKDCGDGEHCVNSYCEPKPVPVQKGACLSCDSKSCANGLKCILVGFTKRCLQPCATGHFCPKGYHSKNIAAGCYCVPDKNICPCQNSSDCDQGEQCYLGRCKKINGGKFGDACDDKITCAQSFTCMETTGGNKVCIQLCGASASNYPPGSPGSACTSTNQCFNGGTCARTPSGTICLPEYCDNGICRNGGQCARVQGLSRPICLCRNSSQCKKGFACNTKMFTPIFRQTIGACAPVQTTKPCESGTACFEGPNKRCGASSQRCYCYPVGTQGIGQDCSDKKKCKESLMCVRTSANPTDSYCFENCTQTGTCPHGGMCTDVGNNIKLCICRTNADCGAGYNCALRGGVRLCVPGNPPNHCGNGTCEPAKGENCSNCKDCACKGSDTCQNGRCVSPTGCGNGLCEGAKGENCSTCPKDCGCGGGKTCQNGRCAFPNPCGNGLCEGAKGENCSTCPKDCGCGGGKVCQNGQCTVPTESTNIQDGGTSGNTNPQQNNNCPLDEQHKECDENGQNCRMVCAKPAGSGCSCNQENSLTPLYPLFFALLAFLLPLFRRRR